jgi:hypothetical protein
MASMVELFSDLIDLIEFDFVDFVDFTDAVLGVLEAMLRDCSFTLSFADEELAEGLRPVTKPRKGIPAELGRKWNGHRRRARFSNEEGLSRLWEFYFSFNNLTET